MIKVKALISGWKEVDRKTAEIFTRNLLNNLPAIKDKDKKIKYINENRLQGTTVEELLSNEGWTR